MGDTFLPPSTAVPPKGFVAAIVGVLTSPRATYSDVVARPRWLGVLLVVLLTSTAPVMLFLSSDIGQRAVIDQQLQLFESFGRTVSDAQYQQLQRMAPFSAYLTAAAQVVGLPLASLVLAGIAFAVFNGALGANATFSQVFSVVAYSSVVTGLRALFSTPLNYARETLASPTNLAAVLPFFEDTTFPGRLLGSIDLFLIWWTVNLAIGLGVLYRRRTAPIATTMLIVYGVIALAIAAVRSMLAGA